MTEILISSEDRIRRAKYFSWFCAAVAILLLSLTFLIVLTLAQMGIRLRVLSHLSLMPMDSENFVSTDPLNKDVADADLITEAFIREFVINRYSVIPDVKEMTRRFSYGGPIHRFLSTKMYAPYAKQKEVRKHMKDTMEGATPVDIEIRNVSHIGNDWRVEFDERTVLSTDKVAVNSYIATLRVENYPSRVSFAPDAINPLGTTIVRYSRHPREN